MPVRGALTGMGVRRRGGRVRPIAKLLVANRGEIAARIMRTARSLGIATVAVYSDADEAALFVESADEAIRIGGRTPRESYLDIGRIVDAARRTGADAVHPGYGFLAENPALAAACADAGIAFVGPRADVIEAMGSKVRAREIMQRAGVPVIPGEAPAEQSDEALRAAALRVGLPVLLKASAGGGGKGMRLVRDEDALDDAIRAARREAEAAFGDGTLLVERYIDRPRHIEVQVFGDEHGQVAHLFERECSVQRRHQKVVEESPSPALDDAQRTAICEAAVRAARAVGYTNAGTVEFVMAPDGSFYFLEMNTRLQVEHPVTELVTGLDLVAIQLDIAQELPLPFDPAAVGQRGSAIECRVYAEDPATGFLPATGTLLDWHLPPLDGVRLDSGVRTGDKVGIEYDPLLAKLIAWGPTREVARRRAARALRQLSALGVVTNRTFLAAVLEHPAFARGEIDTHFIETHFGEAPTFEPSEGELRAAAIAATAAGFVERTAQRELLADIAPGWRNNPFEPQRVKWLVGKQHVEVPYWPRTADSFDVPAEAEGQTTQVRIARWEAPALDLEIDGWRRTWRVARRDAETWVSTPNSVVRLVEEPRLPTPGGTQEGGSDAGPVAPMPGRVVAVHVEAGEEVDEGQLLVTIEAMKMEHAITAPHAGVVARLLVEAGQQVDAGALLVEIDAAQGAGE